MRKRIIISLLVLFSALALGAAVSVTYISHSTSDLQYVIKLHEVEEMRRSLVIDLKTVQADIYSFDSIYGSDPSFVMSNVKNLKKSAQKCTSCHHTPTLTRRIERVQSLIDEYESALMLYVTSREHSEELYVIKYDAIQIGIELISLAEEMSHTASKALGELTRSTIIEITDAKTVIILTVLITFLVGIIIATRLTRSVTKPVGELLTATRAITSGQLGSTIEYTDDTELGELARYFNDMSRSIKEGYELIQREISDREVAEEALAQSEKFLKTVFESINDPFCIFDRDFRIVTANEAYAAMKSRATDDLRGQTCYEVLHGSKTTCKNCVVHTTFLSKDPCAKDKLISLDDGSKVWLEIFTYPIYDTEGMVTHVIEYIRDISERKKTELALRESKQRYELAACGANDGLWDWDLKSNHVYYSPRWKAMLGLSDAEVSNSSDEWFNRVHPDDRVKIEKDLSSHFDGQAAHFENEHRILHRDGTYRWVHARGLAVRNESGKACRVAGSVTDISERKMAEEQLTFDALHDALTGLPNRALFMDRLRHALNRSKRLKDYMFAVLFMDINRFKVINDSMGHTVGDRLLVAISHRLEESLRPGDTVARFGGDEFALLLEELKDRNEATHVAERVHEKLSKPFNLEGQEVVSSASIGITFSMTGYDQPDHIIRDADIAMYHSKRNEHLKYEIFDRSMYANALARMQLETDLRQAIKAGQFFLHYQPIVSVQDGRITGLEALVRWQHPSRGLIYPQEFIHIAEETGLIIELGELILQVGCDQLARWQKKYPACPALSISVNISSKQLRPYFVEKVTDILTSSGIEPGSLILEITESVLMENSEFIAPILIQLRERDVKLHIDDFGTGYSSLSYLHKYPIDVLKIDRSFVRNITSHGENLEVVKAIANLAGSLNMKLVAEGVETEEQISQLKALNCDFIQGFYFSKPMPHGDVDLLLEKGRFDFISYLAHAANES